jgi:hypothetical protein
MVKNLQKRKEPGRACSKTGKRRAKRRRAPSGLGCCFEMYSIDDPKCPSQIGLR